VTFGTYLYFVIAYTDYKLEIFAKFHSNPSSQKEVDMVTKNSISRIFPVLFVIIFLLTDVLPMQTVSAISLNTVDQPVQLSVETDLTSDDWQQIQSLLPTSATTPPVTQIQQAYLKASNSGSNDNFGYAVSLSGDTLAVGAPYESSNATGVNGDQADNSAVRSGAVYIFTRSGATWSQQAYLKASNAEANDQFGYSVSLSGDTLVVGAALESSNATGVNGNEANNSAYGAGAVYVFTRSETTWSQQAYLKASNTDFWGGDGADQFGYSVSISGDTLVVGAIGEDSNATGINGNGANDSALVAGAAYVFTRSGTTWSQQAYLKASNTEADDRFGVAVLASGDALVIGAIGEDSNAIGVNGNQADNSSLNSGAVYVFTRSGTTWSQQSYLKASNTDANDSFGIAVSMSGDTLVVGANGEASNASGINENQADNSSLNAGAAYVFTRSGITWSQQAYLKASNTGAGDEFGRAVSVSGDTLAVGAFGEDSNGTGVNFPADNDSAPPSSGAVYVFTRSELTWNQQSYLKASNTEILGSIDGFGSSVSVSGQTLVAGANMESSNATGVNGNQADNSSSSSGAAYAFVTTPVLSPDYTWSIQVADSPVEEPHMVGAFDVSIAMDQNNHPHISALDRYPYTLRYSTWDGVQWINQVVDGLGTGNLNPDSSIQVDSNALPHISYIGVGGLKYAFWDGTEWQIQSLGVGDSSYTSLALDKATDYPRIAFCSSGLKYASWDGSAWNIQTVDSVCGGGDFGAENSLALDGNGNPHIAYVNGYAYWDNVNSQWVKDATVAYGSSGRSLALDSTGIPHIAYCGTRDPMHFTPQYASWNGSSWDTTTIEDPYPTYPWTCQTISLAIDGNDIPHVSYHNWFDDSIRHMMWNGTTWSSEIVKAFQPQLYAPIATDQNNEPWIAYTDVSSDDLMVAHGTPNPPNVLIINRVNNNPTAATSVDFLVTFSKNVNDVDINDFTLTTTGVTGQAITGVGGSDTTYTVTVDTGFGNGTIRLDMVDDNTIVDDSDNPLGGTEPGDGDFIDGETYDVNKEQILNGGFNTYPAGKKIPTSWKVVKFSTSDGKNTTVKKEGTASVRITGTGVSKTLSQTLMIFGSTGDAFTFSFWVKGKSIPTSGVCRAQILFYNGATLNPVKPTINCVKGTYGFNQKSLAFTAPGDYTKIIIRFTYTKASGQVWFDAVSLSR
jgi:hypothetical protein